MTNRKRRGSTSSSPRNLREASASLKVYDVSGGLVRTVFDTGVPAGRHEVAWQASDKQGHRGKLPVCTSILVVPQGVERMLWERGERRKAIPVVRTRATCS